MAGPKNGSFWWLFDMMTMDPNEVEKLDNLQDIADNTKKLLARTEQEKPDDEPRGRFCTQCGTRTVAQANFCQNCGNKSANHVILR
jgi:membrane protease subunit (stomatin/prohibitin family)